MRAFRTHAVGTGMNLVAALLGFFVLRPIINSRLAPGAGAAAVQAPPEPRIRRVA